MTTSSDNIIPFPGETMAQVEAAAALWLARATSGAMTLGDLAEFEFWRAASPDHDRVYAEFEAMWGGMETVTRKRIAEPRLILEVRPYLHRWAACAASILLLAMIAVQYQTTWRYDYHTGPGEIRTIALADGSRMFLKGDTAVDAQVAGAGARTIRLARGEAFFEVRHDPARPFTVDAGSGLIRDIGTGFSVRRVGQSVTVGVDHGIVAVAAGGATDVLGKGHQITFDRYAMGSKSLVETGTISAWRRGLYVADGKPLAQVLADLDEYFPGQIVVTSRALGASRINAVVQLGHIDAWLDALNQKNGVSVRRWGPLTLVSERTT